LTLESQPGDQEKQMFVLSAGSGGDFSYEEYLTKTFTNVVIVTPDCTTFQEDKIVANEETGSTILSTPICLIGVDPKYTTAVDPALVPKFHRFHELYNGLAKYFGEDTFHFSFLKVNIEGFEYPVFADIFSNNPERLLNGVSQIHIELHRQGMQKFGLNWNSLVFAELLFAHFFSGGYVPFANEKWHDSTAAQDVAFVNQTWFILSENNARNEILDDIEEESSKSKENKKNMLDSSATMSTSPISLQTNDNYSFHNASKNVANDYYCHTGPLLSSQVSELIMKESEETGWDTRPDLVDFVPEWALHLYYCAADNCPGWNPHVPSGTKFAAKWLVKKIEEKALSCSTLNSPRIKVYWVYVKKYSNDTRNEFPIHTDICDITGNIILNNENKDFFGGEYFLLNEQRTVELKVDRDVANAESVADLNERRRAMTANMLKSGEIRKWNIKNKQGSGVIHFGKSGHGVLSVRKGIRYCIVFFANIEGNNNQGEE
jgi:hypothetical protein